MHGLGGHRHGLDGRGWDSAFPPDRVGRGGNHGAAVAYAAQKLSHHAEIFVPVITPPNKVNRLRHYGASINVTGNNYSEALAASRERAAQTGGWKILQKSRCRDVLVQGA